MVRQSKYIRLRNQFPLRLPTADMLRGGLGRSAIGRRFFSGAVLVPVHDLLVGIHGATGLSWSVLIPTATFGFRFGMTFPLAVLNRLRLRKQASVQPLLSAMLPVLKAQLAQSVTRGQSNLTSEQIVALATKERRRRRLELFRHLKCQKWKTLALPSVQIPLFIAMSLTIRAMCGWAVLDGIDTEPQFIEEGLGWCPSLVEPDPYGVIPLALGAAALTNVELNAAMIPSSSRRGPSAAVALANLSRVGALIFMAMSFQAPVAIGLYWLMSNIFSLIQNLLLDHYLPVNPRNNYPASNLTHAELDSWDRLPQRS